jgi:hypothetical protein
MLPIALLLAGLSGIAMAAPQPPPLQGAPNDLSWPRSVTANGQRVELYQPQIESWDAGRLSGRLALAIGPQDGAPAFGVAHFAAAADVDKAAGLVRLTSITIQSVQIPTAPDRDDAVKTLLQSRIPAGGITAALEHLQATYAVSQQIGRVASVPVQNDPPRLIFSAAPAALVLINGTPALSDVPGSPYQRVLNTQPLVVRDGKGGWFARVGGAWYGAPDPDGAWAPLAKPPADLATAAEHAERQHKADPLTGASGKLFVSTTPAELVLTAGAAQFSPVEGTALLEMRNADHAVFLDPSQNRYYVLVSGRWFAAPALSGPWSYVPGGSLPPEMAKIRTDDPKADALVSVPGTPQAREAVIASSIAQTATVTRSKATLAVDYDGAPRFAPIPGTQLQYAVNTPTAVIMVSPTAYYSLSQGVWFVSTQPTGPWRVADSIPAPIYTIPPSSPVYYVTYVQVYQATPGAVVIGYTPGYMGVLVSPDGTVVYGTGYVYPAYVGTVYYPPPATYGYGAGFALGTATGFAFGFAAGYALSPHWGPYWGPCCVNWQHVNINQTNIYGRWGSATVTHAWGWSGTTAWQANSAHAFNPYTGRSYSGQSFSGTNYATGVSAAGQRGITTNAATGAVGAHREGAAIDRSTGQYAAGRQAAGVNPETGRAGAASRTVSGNVQDGTRTIDRKGAVVNTKTDTGAAWNNGTLYAGHDDNVYRRQDGTWEKHTDDGWQPVDRSGPVAGSLEQQRQAQMLGQQRANAPGRSAGGQGPRARRTPPR